MDDEASPYIEAVVVSTSVILRSTMHTLMGHWRVIYEMDEALIKKYCDNIFTHIKTLLIDIENTVEEKKHDMAKKVETIILEGRQLQRELGVDVSSFTVPEDLPLSTMMNLANERMEKCRLLKQERIDKMKALKERETPLCALLGEQPYVIDSPVPSMMAISQLSNHIKSLEELKEQRQTIVKECNSSVKEMMITLEVEPLTDLEAAAFRDISEFRELTLQYLSRLQELRVNYEDRVKLETEEFNRLRTRLKQLWDLIEEDTDHRVSFMSRIQGIGSSMKRELTKEITRCEAIKRANLIPMINKLREQIRGAWDRLTYTEDQREGFAAFFTEEFNDDVLALHEIELDLLLRKYDENKRIYELALKRKNLMAQKQRLDALALNPQRLKNRGGQLLREETERKDVEKKLPKVESELEQELVTYYTHNGQSFLWHGADLLKTIKDEQKSCNTQHQHATNRLTVPHGSKSVASSLSDSVASYSQFQPPASTSSPQPPRRKLAIKKRLSRSLGDLKEL